MEIQLNRNSDLVLGIGLLQFGRRKNLGAMLRLEIIGINIALYTCQQ
jgi:hypothetical protein